MNNQNKTIGNNLVKRQRSINDSLSNPFYIFAPNFRNSSGGIRVLHYLCHILNELGEEAYILNADTVSPRLRTPILTLAKIRDHYISGRSPITIYPEVIHNDPAGTPLTIRWLLNIPGHLGLPIEYGENDLVFYYEKWCVPDDTKGEQLFIHPVDDTIFNNENNPDDKNRVHECFYANKFYKSGNLVNAEHRELLSLGQDIPRTPEEISDILRKSKILYCYEPSGIISEAQACGCPVLLVRSEYWPLGPDDTHHKIPGSAVYGEPNALSRALATLPSIKQVHINARDNSWVHTERMVNIANNALNNITKSPPEKESKLQKLWTLPKKDRIKSAEDFVDEYINSTLYFPDNTKKISREKLQSLEYKKFINRSSLQEIDGQILAERMFKWKGRPHFNVVIELAQGEEELLADSIDSISDQWYQDWHLTIVSESEPFSPDINDLPQISWLVSVKEDIHNTINKAISLAKSSWILFMEPGYRLEPHALAYLSDTVNFSDNTHLIYCDEDKLSLDGSRTDPHFRSGFNAEMLRSSYYLGPCLSISKKAFEATGGVCCYGTAGLFDLALKINHKFSAKSCVHQSDILFHAPALGSRALDPEQEKQVVENHLSTIGVPASIDYGLVHGTQKIIYEPCGNPLVSIVIPTHNQQGYLTHCIETLLTETKYKNFEVILVDHQTNDVDAVEYIDSLYQDPRLANRLSVLKNNSSFNYAALCNAGASVAKGEFILFLDNDTEFIQGEWLDILVGLAQQPLVAAVAPRLSKPDSNLAILNQSPRILGMRPLAGNFSSSDANIVEPGYFGNQQITQEVSALSGSCFLVNAALFRKLKGFDDCNTPIHEPVLDICLRFLKENYKLLWTPWSDVVHHNRATRNRIISNEETSQVIESGLKSEQEFIMRNYMRELANDPYYHRKLSLLEPYALEVNQVIDWDPRFHDRLHILGSPLTSGAGEYRLISPFRGLQKAGLAQTCVLHSLGHMVSRVLHPIELARANPDCFFIQQAIDDTHIAHMKRYRQFNRDTFIAYSIDDILGNLPKKHHLYNYHIREGKSRLREALGLVDRLVASTEPIADFCRNMIDDIVVVPNTLEAERWLGHESLRRASPKPRVGWAGAMQHLGDLELIKEVVEATHHEVDWIFMGLCPDFLKPYIHEEHKFVKFADYPAKLASLNLDLAIAPLEQNLFNEGKSNLRLLEYGIMGWPVVCSDVFPYRTNNAPVKRVQNVATEWVEAIRERVHDLDTTAKEGDTLRKWVLEHYILENRLDEWLNALSPSKR